MEWKTNTLAFKEEKRGKRKLFYITGRTSMASTFCELYHHAFRGLYVNS
jgi:hypothetical protein